MPKSEKYNVLDVREDVFEVGAQYDSKALTTSITSTSALGLSLQGAEFLGETKQKGQLS